MTVPHKIRTDLLSNGQQYSISPASPPDQTPEEVLYLRVNYMTDQDGSISDVWTYGKFSGTYDPPPGTSIDDFLGAFLTALVTGTSLPPRTESLPSIGPPVIRAASYVVFAVDSGGVATFEQTDGITTNDSTPAEYFNLHYHCDDDKDDSGFPCHIVYFRAINGSRNGTKIPPVPDGFNLNLDIGTIDPDIQNTGHRLRHHHEHDDAR